MEIQGRSIRIKGIALVVGFWLSAMLSLPAPAEQVLKGGVEEENYRINHDQSSGKAQTGQTENLRFSRAPAALVGSAVDGSAFAQSQASTAGSSPLRGVVDEQKFAVPPPKNFDIGTERGSHEMTLAWEAWHHQLSEIIYKRWQRAAHSPGQATIRVTVTRNRQITAQVIETSGDPDFDDTILVVIGSLNQNPGLTFPAKSQRQVVTFEGDYIAGSHLRPGFDWNKNDFEKVRQDY